MSAFLLGLGFRADMGTCVRKLVLLKLIDACEDDGTRIFPAIATVARAAQCSARQVQRELRAFLDLRLIRVVREGGKGPRSTTEYSLDLDVLAEIAKAGWDAYVAAKDQVAVSGTAANREPGQEAVSAEGANRDQVTKGDTVSPLDGVEKGDTGDTIRVTPETPKGDSWSHTTPPDPSLDPSIERERGREDDRKKIEQAFERAWQAWPTSIGDSRPDALKAWLGLSPDERALAAAEAGRYVVALKATGRKHIISHAVYLREKRWTQLPPPEPEKPVAMEAKAFGKLWMAHRLTLLLAGPTAPDPGLTAFERGMVADGKWSEEALRLEKRAKSGFPAVNALHERARFFGRGVTVAPGLERLAEAMEKVRVGGERFAEWQAEHQQRGWPWPEFGNAEWVYFPAGGPARLQEFEDAVRGKHHDGDGQQAAE